MKKIIAIRHIHFEDLGTWEMTLKMRFQAAEIEYVDAPIADFSDTEKFLAADLLVVLGAPIGAFDEAIYPFLARELVVIDARLKSGNPLIGVCLGAQIIARLSGANVEPMSVKEIGFAPISACGVLAELDSEKVLHWHGDRFELPENAQHLSGS